MKFRKTTYSLILIGLISLSVTVLSGCADDIIPAPEISTPGADGPKVDAYLSLNVADFTVSGSVSRAEPEVATEEENRISDIWVFQYDTDGNQLINPVYYVISDPEELNNLHVLLRDGVVSTICVVANTANPTWALGKDNFQTYSGLKSAALPSQNPIKGEELTRGNNPKSIPMFGVVSDVTIIPTTTPTPTDIVIIKLTKIFAKIRISFGELAAGMSPKSMDIVSIPRYCRVASLGIDIETGEALDDKSPASYPTNDTYWTVSYVNTTSYKEGDEYVIYIPENLQGKIEDLDDDSENQSIPTKAFGIELTMNYKAEESVGTSELNYTMYPGESTSATESGHFNNFNIKRNHVYRVKINIRSASQDKHSPSSNCFVVIPGETLSFEPYYRTETGGIDGSDTDEVFKFSNYLDPEDPPIMDDETGEIVKKGKKVISRVQIIWQTKDAIGDNRDGDLVWFEKDEQYPLHSKVYVKTQSEGNALIGAYNDDNEIIWSWHIWVTPNDPGNGGNAVVYTTYDWDQSKVYSYQQGIIDGTEYERVNGFGVMPCNLGALANEPASESVADVIKTHGMLYQWGRKDPFPPASYVRMGDYQLAYSDQYAGIHYDYTNITKVAKTHLVEDDDVFSFHTKLVGTISDQLDFSIHNPMVFIAGTTTDPTVSLQQNYYANGDWMTKHNNKLWGGLEISNNMKRLKISGSNNKYMYENYGNKKTIFDPCPKGWRVPPGDLWLGFTKTGWNPSSVAEINQDDNKTAKTTYGVHLYMRESKWNNSNPDATTLYFPCQGLRISNGVLKNTGQCGNYHNATSDNEDIVNILHVHRNSTSFHVFEYAYPYYNVKSLGGPIRCVRDKK